MSRLAAKGGWAIYYYAPSLVQHVGRESTWGGGYHYAPDFDPRFKIDSVMPHVPFNGDHYIGDEVRRLIAAFDLRSAIETGTWSAHTTRELRAIVPRKVTTIDTTTEHLLGEFGPGALDDLRTREHPDGARQFERDAGTGASGPRVRRSPSLRLSRCARCGLSGSWEGARCAGGRPALQGSMRDRRSRCSGSYAIVAGYNWVDWGRRAEPLSYELIAPKLPAVYPKGYRYHYNDAAAGCQRGIIYIYPQV